MSNGKYPHRIDDAEQIEAAKGSENEITIGHWMQKEAGPDRMEHPDGLTRGQFQIFPIPEDEDAEKWVELFECAPMMLNVLRFYATEQNHLNESEMTDIGHATPIEKDLGHKARSIVQNFKGVF